MKILFGALALALAAPAAAQTAPADPHAGHAQHQHGTAGQHGTMPAGHDHAKMMEDCKKAAAEGKCKEHCEAMMKQHGASASKALKADGHEGQAH